MACRCNRGHEGPSLELDRYFDQSADLEEEISRTSRDYLRWVQGALNKFAGARLNVDGISGQSTREAVARFQRSRGLTADGIVGARTEAALVQAGAGSPPSVDAVPAAPAAGSGTPSTTTLDIVPVNGIQVARRIAENTRALLEAAAADGVRLSGGGFRSPQRQIDLRRKNCGTSDYAVYQMPSSQCTPPTARPGQSNHERGLAIDFTYEDGGIKTRDNPGFLWLRDNAARFGFYNLPSEPWHWSVDGK
jgi:peptidoglycan hydrolase-like protein with peptidoglycan-binding domain